MHSSKNKFLFNSAPPKSKATSNLHDYYKSYADQQKSNLTNSEPHKPLKASSQVKLKGSSEDKTQEITFQNNRIVVRNVTNNSMFTNNSKLVLKKKSPSENENTGDPRRKNSKKLVASSVTLDNKRSTKTNFSYDSNAAKKNFFGSPSEGTTNLENLSKTEPRKSKNDIRLPKIDTTHESIKTVKSTTFNSSGLSISQNSIETSLKMESPSKSMNTPMHKPSLDENGVQYEETSPIVQNRNVRVITKHSIIPFKETKPYTEIKDLKTIDEDVKNNERTNDDVNKKNKRLSDIGLGADELNKLISKLNVDKKKDDQEETKDNKSKKMSESGVMVFGSKQNEGHNPENGSVSPLKSSNILTYESNSMSPQKQNKLVQNFAFKSKAGAMPGNTPKTNQDVYITIPSFGNSKDRYFFGVADGHGVNGHLVSGYIKQNLPKFIEKVFREQNENESPQMMRNALFEGHLSTYHGLLDTNIDSNFSGSTCVTIFMTSDKKIYCSNVGDSRAIICKNKNNNWSAVPLSRDQKPDDPQEMQRILKNGGRVEAFKDFMGNPVGPARVWLKHENIPGLAMARSIGDRIAAQVGVIADPEIKEFEITEEDKFIVIASDGVWEFLSNAQVMNYVLPFYQKNQPEAACEKLIKESTICWKREDEVIDDITAVLIILK